MTATNFRRMLKAQPFRAFLVKTTDGDTHVVGHPDYALVTPSNTEVIIFDKDDHYRWVAMNHIVSLEAVRNGKKSGRR
jgi:hypothetical protein